MSCPDIEALHTNQKVKLSQSLEASCTKFIEHILYYLIYPLATVNHGKHKINSIFHVLYSF